MSKKSMEDVLNTKENSSITSKARFWVGILWVDSLDPDWISKIDQRIQNPYCYAIHDKDVDNNGNPRKPHVHLIIAFPNTTTYKHALSIFQSFTRKVEWADYDTYYEAREAITDKKEVLCCNTCFRVLNVRYMYEYLIHNTDDARKKNKYQYDSSDRIEGLGFDIGLFEQISLADKRNMVFELSKFILDNHITNYADFYIEVCRSFDMSYTDVIYGYSGHFERLCKGNFLKLSNHFNNK